MDLDRLREIVDTFFDRAVIAISYSASARLLDRLTSSSAHGPSIGLVSLGVTVLCFFLLADQIKGNACLQTTLAIIISKLVIHVCTPMEPSARHDGWVLPGIICFFLCLYSTLCIAMRQVLVLERLQKPWDLIVPFIVIFSTSSILKAIKQNAEMRFLYVTIFCHLLWRTSYWDTPTTGEASHELYLAQFIDSIVARGILIVLDDLVFGAILRPGIGLCLLFASWLTILCVWFPRATRSSQCQLCVGVLTYSLCSRLLHALQSLCYGQISITFAVVAAFMVLCLHLQPQSNGASTSFDFTPVCSNALSILWSSMLDSWLFSFYQEWEQLLMYAILFWGMQGLKDTIEPILQTSAALLLSPSEMKNNEAMLIASETEASAAKAH